MNVKECILTRTSTRKYLDIEIEEEKLNTVLEAGRYAPSGGNNQTNHFIVIENKEVLDTLAMMVQEEFSKMEVYEGMYKSMVSSITRSKTGKYRYDYNCKVLIVVANVKEYGNNMADVSCSLENMMIQANDLGLGTCWINQLKWLNENERILTYLYSLGLKDNERVYGSLAIGYSDEINRVPKERHGNVVTYVK